MKTLWDGQFIEDVFQLNRGLLRTVVELLYRPGRLAVDYLVGHRKRYFNFLAFLLLIVATDALLRNYSTLPMTRILQERFAITTSFTETADAWESILKVRYRVVILSAIPIAACWQWLLLRRTKFNYWEHFVAVCYLIAGQSLISIIGGILPVFPLPETVLVWNYRVTALTIAGYTLLFYWQFIRQFYPTWKGKAWRTVVIWLAVNLTILMILAGAIGFVSGYNNAVGVD